MLILRSRARGAMGLIIMGVLGQGDPRVFKMVLALGLKAPRGLLFSLGLLGTIHILSL